MNASASRDYYMSHDEIAQAVSEISTLAEAVVAHGDHLQLTHGVAYQPQGMTPKFLWVRKPYHSEISGYAFGQNDSSTEHHVPSGLIVAAEGKILIATHREFPRWHRNLYIVHTLRDYVAIWLVQDRFIPGDEARRAIDAVLFQMAQLLPEDHPRRHALASTEPAGEFASSHLER